jgi:hypothetical protein
MDLGLKIRSFMKIWRNMGSFPKLVVDLACELAYIVLKISILYWKLQSQNKHFVRDLLQNVWSLYSGKHVSGKWLATFSFHTYPTFKLHKTKWKMITCVEDVLWTWWLNKPWIIAQFCVKWFGIYCFWPRFENFPSRLKMNI